MLRKPSLQFFYRSDFLIIAAVIILGIALSGSSLRFSQSTLNLSKEKSSMLPFDNSESQKALQFNSIGFKTEKEIDETAFECPKPTNKPDPVYVTPKPTCEPIICPKCSKEGGSCDGTWENTTCHPCPITDCTKCPPPPPTLPPAPPPPPPEPETN